jgi:hypothetical protein
MKPPVLENEHSALLSSSYIYIPKIPPPSNQGGEANYQHLGDTTAAARQIDILNTNNIQ